MNKNDKWAQSVYKYKIKQYLVYPSIIIPIKK